MEQLSLIVAAIIRLNGFYLHRLEAATRRVSGDSRTVTVGGNLAATTDDQ